MSSQTLDEEFITINSIYPSCFVLLNNDLRIYTLKILEKPYSITLKFPEAYPFEKPYIMESRNIEKSIVERFLTEIPLGNACIFDLIGFLRELEPIQKHFNNINTYALNPSFKKEEMVFQDEIPWIVSEALILKKSKFIGRMLKVKSLDMVYKALENLQYEKSIINATHNIWAYRLIGGNGQIISDNNDDGEKGASLNLSHLLHSMGVKNVLVVVSRWYGGIKLGPDRFKLINSSAKAALLLGSCIEETKIKKNKNFKKKKNI
ncbi:hypothetical protein PORY_002738 [Pneumocystis oryctolagi]|uniref:Uncharacterized protein n=1 Tax=Pneumocystis oryctolagi TaxID=42067 RepID=A0ACB7CA10_9ASCO|nr:hypothetical protein PORY_002738 [Pneumocystis oryctolagi]